MWQRAKQYYLNIIHKLTNATSEMDIAEYEMKLLAAVTSPMMFIAAFFSVFIGYMWKISIAMESIYFAGMFLSALLMLLTAEADKIKTPVKAHIICFLFSVVLFLSFFCYYRKIGVLFWFILFIITLFANISSNRMLILYLTAIYLLTYISSLVMYRDINIQADQTYHLTLLLLLLFVIAAGFVTNLLYHSIIYDKLRKYMELSSQKEEITALYEEITASEQELQDQNEALNAYNEEIRETNERLEFLAYNDTLTGLPNRKRLMEQLDLLIDLSRESHSSFAIAMIDIDNFKRVNDSLGHNSGDELLLEFASCLQEGISGRDMLGRLGGDEFALLIRSHQSGEELYAYLQKLNAAVDRMFSLDDSCVRVSASFGIAVWPQDAATPTDLLKAADTAMYKAKELGKNNVQFYHSNMQEEILSKMNLESKMIQALENKEFYLEYQPLFAPDAKSIHCFEALIRWETSDQKKISPMEFIPFAEENGLIHDIGSWVIRTACYKIQELNQVYGIQTRIAVNISPVQMQGEHFLETVTSILNEIPIPKGSLEFEITESVFIHNKEQAVAKIKELKNYGISFSMDDFGTGYSSLSYLISLPIDKLKIDRSFIQVITENNPKNAIVKAIIEMVHGLDMEVVAEGIETSSQLAYLQDIKCDLYQGFALSRPLSEALMQEGLVAESRSIFPQQ